MNNSSFCKNKVTSPNDKMDDSSKLRTCANLFSVTPFLLSVNAFNLDQSKNLSCGEELTYCHTTTHDLVVMSSIPG